MERQAGNRSGRGAAQQARGLRASEEPQHHLQLQDGGKRTRPRGGEFLRQVRAVLQQRVSSRGHRPRRDPLLGAEGSEAYHRRHHVSGENPLRDTGISPCPDLSAADNRRGKPHVVQSRAARHRGIAENHPRQPQPCGAGACRAADRDNGLAQNRRG